MKGRDRILFQGMQFYAYHGVYPEERRLGQPFSVDVELELDLRQAGESDRLEDTVDYALVYQRVQKVVEGEPRNLLESLAQAVAKELLSNFPVDQVRVRVVKPRPPIPGHYHHVAVEVVRAREDG